MERSLARLTKLGALLTSAALLAGCQTISWPQIAAEQAEAPASDASVEALDEAPEAAPAEPAVEAQTETAEETPDESLFGSLVGSLKGAFSDSSDEAAVEAIAEPAAEAPTDTAEALAAPSPADSSAIAALPVPQPGAAPSPAGPVPHIYMALQPDGEGKPISVVFAIDAARDNTPTNDPAIRLTPENGQCNPQEMRNYNFPPKYLARPITSEFEQAQGLSAGDLPAFMAISVTDEMLAAGLTTDREETRALNICTRKLWEELMRSKG
jgi:hypothetical protein